MQFKIISVLSLAMLAAALPTEDIQKRTDSQEAANQCSQGQTLQCCNQVLTGILPIGIQCVNINLLAVLQGQCGASQKLACCSTGAQNGLINVGSVCPQIL